MLLKHDITRRFVVKDKVTGEWLATLSCSTYEEAEIIVSQRFPGRRVQITISI